MESNVNMKIISCIPIIFFMINDRPDLKTVRLKISKNFKLDIITYLVVWKCVLTLFYHRRIF